MPDLDAQAAANAPLPDEPTPTTDTGAPQEPAPADDQGDAAASGDAPATQEQDGDDAAAEPSEGGQKPKPKGGFQRRIDELTRQRADAEREKGRLLALVEKLTGGQQAQQPAAAHGEQPPREEDYPDPFAFTEAKAVYAAKQAWRAEADAQRNKAAEEAAAREAAERKAAFDRQVEAARERFDDFDAVVYRHPKDGGPPINDAMAEVIQTSERGAELAYYLGTHVEEAKKLYGLSPVAAARELGLIEAKLSLPKPRNITKAPDPIRPVGGGGASPALDPNKLSYEEYVKARREGRIR